MGGSKLDGTGDLQELLDGMKFLCIRIRLGLKNVTVIVCSSLLETLSTGPLFSVTTFSVSVLQKLICFATFKLFMRSSFERYFNF